MENSKTVIEINGIKMQIDLRHATKIEEYKVGDKVKVLTKKYSDTWESHIGVIAGFDAFKERPTIIIAYMDMGYDGGLKFAHINKDSKDIELAPAQDFDLNVEKSDVLSTFDKKIEKLELDIKEIQKKKNYFLNQFGKHFED